MTVPGWVISNKCISSPGKLHMYTHMKRTHVNCYYALSDFSQTGLARCQAAARRFQFPPAPDGLRQGQHQDSDPPEVAKIHQQPRFHPREGLFGFQEQRLDNNTGRFDTCDSLRFVIVLLLSRWRRCPEPAHPCACGSEPWIGTPESSKKSAPRGKSCLRRRSVPIRTQVAII